MADPNEDESISTTRGTAGDGDDLEREHVSVNWRGIVDDGTPPLKSARLARSVRDGAGGVLVALGLKRRRLPDGTRAPRPWGRVVVIWGGALALFLLFSAGHVVSAGNVGVPVTLGSAGEPLSDGLHFTAPWPLTRVREMSTRTQNYTMSAAMGEGGTNADDSVTVLGRDGATAQVDATVLFRVDRANATMVYENVGTNFTSAIIRPSARACIRTAFTTRTLVDASTQDWPQISQDIATCMADKIEPRGITLEDFQLRDVRLSPQVQQAIEASVAAAETQGNQLSEAYLQFAYIQALRAFAESQGNVTLVLPSSGSEVGLDVPIPEGSPAPSAPAQ